MKRHLLYVFLLFFLLTGHLFAQKSELKIGKIKVNELKCKMCAVSIELAVKKLKGIEKYEANIDDEIVIVKYNPKDISLSEIISAIKKIGYEAEEYQ